MKKNLWLASWYPNKISPLNGDFIQRHAEAAALYEPVHVIFVVKDAFGAVTNQLAIENFTRGNLTESIAYYKSVRTGIRSLDKIVSMLTYLKIFRKLVLAFIKTNGTPSLVHVHVAMWAGVMAMWLKRKKAVPYIVTEHWTGYHKNAIENAYNQGWLFKNMLKSVLKNAELILPDSSHLGNTIHDNIYPIKFIHVSNVVNTLYFNSSFYNGKEFRFIHVSSMKLQKNTEGLLRTFSQLLLTYKECRLIMIGAASDDLIKKADDLGLKKNVDWKGVISNRDVANAMSSSSALVMFSMYENQPCVILEALCSGLPVISTNVGGIPEVINNDNGILIDSQNEMELLQAMITMVESYSQFDKIKISELAKEKYNYNTIGTKISGLYQDYRKSIMSTIN